MKLPRWLEHLAMRLAMHRRIDGLWLGLLGDKKHSHALDRVERALALIRQYDPPRYRRVLRDLERIWVTVLPGMTGRFDPELNRCSLDIRFVKEATVERIASTIVHEATHAHPWLRKLGYPVNLVYRIERICMRQQLAFVDRLPEGTAAGRKELELGLTLPPAAWSAEARQKIHLAGERDAARYAGIPDWLFKILVSPRFLRRRRGTA